MTENAYTQTEQWDHEDTHLHTSPLFQSTNTTCRWGGTISVCRRVCACMYVIVVSVHVSCVFAWWAPVEGFFYKLNTDSPSQWGWRWRGSRRGRAAPCCCPLVLGTAWSRFCRNRRSPGCARGTCPCTQSSTPTKRSLPWWPAGNKTYWFQL